jgi:hypothetical protein
MAIKFFVGNKQLSFFRALY